MPVSPSSLPIWEIHPGIVRQLTADNRLVLVAPTGSGKTTQVPQMILDAGLAGGRKVMVLQPRRVAARTLAARVAWERSGRLGGEVGYQIRFEDETSAATRILFVTEGVLLRKLQEDRNLADLGAILFDEFHERNLLSDVALAVVKQVQTERRPDLKLVVMSATLDAEPVAAYLGRPGPNGAPATPAPILVSEGQSFPVEVRFADYQDNRPPTEQAATAVERIITAGETGDILVFMPGMAEIGATLNALRATSTGERLALIPLHGELPPEQQDLAFEPNPLRKVVVATNVAETSVTIDGIRHVVDSGLARVARYDAERGIQTLLIEEISRASADQRKGRAGRTAPGTCWRLWTESGHLNRPERNTPEIRRSDLAEVVLLLHSLGIRRAATFDWLDKPDPAAVERAERLLFMLGALAAEPAGPDGTESPGAELTAVGRQMLRLPMHPRYSRMLIEGSRRQCVRAAALCAALVSGRDLLMRLGRDDSHIAEARELFEGGPQSDFYTLMRAWQFAKNANYSVDACRRRGVHAATAREVTRTYEQIVDLCERHGLLPHGPQTDNAPAEAGAPARPAGDDPLLKCIAAGFADQVAVRRDLGTLDCDLTEGRRGTLMRESVVQQAGLLVVASIREIAGRTGLVTLLGQATAVKREWLDELFPHLLHAKVEHLYDRTHKRVAAVRLVRFSDLVIGHEHQKDLDPEASGACLADAARRGWIELPLFNHEVKQFIARVNLVAAVAPDLEFPPLDDAALRKCLAAAFHGLSLAKEAQVVHLLPFLRPHLAREQLGWLDELMPASVPGPGDRPLKLAYPESALDEDGAPNSPEVQVKLTDFFPVKTHPHICEGRLPVRLWLQTPEGKRLESTCNWPAWRANTYPKLRAGLQKKYPGFTWL